MYGRRGDLFGGTKVGAGAAPARIPAPRFRALLIADQAAASIILLVAAALFTRALLHVTTVEIGFRPETLLDVQVSLGADYDDVRRREYWDMAIDRIHLIPGVEAVAVAGYGPMKGGSASGAIASLVGGAGSDQLIRKFHLPGRRVIADEPALLENASRGPVFRMTERKQSGDTGPTGHIDDGRQRLRGIALSPGVCC